MRARHEDGEETPERKSAVLLRFHRNNQLRDDDLPRRTPRRLSRLFDGPAWNDRGDDGAGALAGRRLRPGLLRVVRNSALQTAHVVPML